MSFEQLCVTDSEYHLPVAPRPHSLVVQAMSTFITGADGFVGKSIGLACLESGEGLRVLVRSDRSAEEWAARGAEATVGSIADPALIAKAAAGSESFVHAASANAPGSSPRALGWINVAGTENALRAAAHVGCGRFIHMSCADVTLHDGDRVGWNEDRTPAGKPLGAHARTKLLTEAVVLAHTGPMDTMALRPSWIWGPGDTSRLPYLCREMSAGGIQLVGTGESLLATVYIDHLVQAALGAIGASGVRGEAFCINDPEMHSAREFFSKLSDSVGGPAPRKGLPLRWSMLSARLRGDRATSGLRPSDVAVRGISAHFDYQRAARKLGYSPSLSVSEGMERLRGWATEQGGHRVLAELARAPSTDSDIAAQASAAKA